MDCQIPHVSFFSLFLKTKCTAKNHKEWWICYMHITQLTMCVAHNFETHFISWTASNSEGQKWLHRSPSTESLSPSQSSNHSQSIRQQAQTLDISSTLKGHIWSHSLLIFPPRQSDYIHTQNRQVPKQLECPNPLTNIYETAINRELLPGLAPPCRDWVSKTLHDSGFRTPKAVSLFHRVCWSFPWVVPQLWWS